MVEWWLINVKWYFMMVYFLDLAIVEGQWANTYFTVVLEPPIPTIRSPFYQGHCCNCLTTHALIEIVCLHTGHASPCSYDWLRSDWRAICNLDFSTTCPTRWTFNEHEGAFFNSVCCQNVFESPVYRLWAKCRWCTLSR